MSDAAATAPPPPPDKAPAPGFLATLLGVYTEPVDTFRALAAHPRFWAPLLGFMALTALFTFVWLRNVDPVELTKVQLEERGVFDRVPPEQHAKMVQRQANMFPFLAWLGPVLGPVAFVILAAVFLFVYRFFYASETTFRQSLTIVFWTFFATGLVTTPLTLLILWLKGDWNVDPPSVIQANLAVLLDRSSAAKPLYALFSSLDLFTFWTIFLLSAGYAAASRRSVGSAAAGVVALWIAYVLVKVGLSFIF